MDQDDLEDLGLNEWEMRWSWKNFSKYAKLQEESLDFVEAPEDLSAINLQDDPLSYR